MVNATEQQSELLCHREGEGEARSEQIERLLTWLARAYTAEAGRAQRLEARALRFSHSNALAEKLRNQALKTRRHAVRLKESLDRIGQKRWNCAPVSSAAGHQSEEPASELLPQGDVIEFAPELGRELWEVILLEQGEVAMYTALLAAASALGFQETVRVCSEILQEEKEFSYWLLDYIDRTTRQAFREG